ncbi:MAG: membrane protein insertion efficiency factor YidD [Bacillota bacterium]|nr:membrane protein insertion efficiency factor YidD [Bacillota bacterium]
MFKKICLLLIKFYRLYISPLKPRVCRFYPSCSQYTYEAVERYGIVHGLYMGLKRILRCHPFNPGGYDPVE